MKREDPSSYLDIFREFEAVKRTIDKRTQNKVTMTIPRAMLDEICQKKLHENFESVVKASPYKDQMELRYDKLRINADLIINLFAQASTKIIQLIGDALVGVKSKDVDILLLVGGFSESKIIQGNIKARFPNKRVIFPEDAGLAVLKGAVLFGHKPEYIVTRIVRYTYGVRVRELFNPKIHDKHRLIKKNGLDRCENIFCIYAKRGSAVNLGERIPHKLSTTTEVKKNLTFAIFQSPKECPQYTDEDGCTCLGKVVIKVTPSKEEQMFNCVMMFGHTELKVTVYDEQTGKECNAVLDLI
ncbi:unnamed protein product [Mytilus coruscus]|uniref:Uncharacterized protein n=1 Tax=Mytilus coruscus TaxID=42192 RepID=A0A6J8BT89_MYTCO|nr:unnamed protein product [Mytilus coruscus]